MQISHIYHLNKIHYNVLGQPPYILYYALLHYYNAYTAFVSTDESSNASNAVMQLSFYLLSQILLQTLM